MIRLVQRKLIIPRGDTGSFIIPALIATSNEDVAFFIIFDPLTQTKIYEQAVTIQNDNTLLINFTHEATSKLVPGNYVWDIKFYKNPIYNEDNELIDAEQVDSYFSCYRMPKCEIRE